MVRSAIGGNQQQERKRGRNVGSCFATDFRKILSLVTRQDLGHSKKRGELTTEKGRERGGEGETVGKKSAPAKPSLPQAPGGNARGEPSIKDGGKVAGIGEW